MDIRAYEAMPPDSVAAELRPRATALLRDAIALVQETLDACDAGGPGDDPAGVVDGGEEIDAPYLTFERALDRRLSDQERSAHIVGDIAFMAQLELRQRQERIDRLTGTPSALALLGECDSALRRIRKALGAIDRAIATAEKVAPRVDFLSELQVSLTVRRSYAKFRARIPRRESPDERELYPLMRATGTAIAVLIGWDVYPDLRIRDRLQLRDLQRRILEWLRPDRRVDHTAGVRLWQDLIAFVDLLPQVNRRQELVEHDLAVLRDVRAALDPARADAPVSSAVRDELLSLEGLDDGLDQVIAAPAITHGECVAHLDRLLARSAVAAPAAPDRRGDEW